MERGAITRAAAMMSSMVMLPLCWMFFTFLRSLGGSFKALMTRAAAEGTTEQVACLFWILSCTVTLRPFQSAVALAMSSPIFLGERPRGPTLGARELVAPTSPPTALRYTNLTSLGSNLGPMADKCKYQVLTCQVVDEGNFNFPTTTGLYRTRVLWATVSARSPM